MPPLLTTSAVRAYQVCPRLYRHKYIDLWRQVEDTEAMRLGTIIHAGLEALLSGTDGHAAVGGLTSDPFLRVRARAMLRGYVARWGTPDKADSVERVFRFPLPHPDDPSQDHPSVSIGGKWDAIKDGCVIEHKTTSWDITEGSLYWQRLEADWQISHYTLAGMLDGIEVKGVLYDVLKVPEQRPLKATPEDKRKFKKDGTLYANQRAEDETPEEYRVRITTAIMDNLDAHFARRLVTRQPRHIRDHLRDAWDYAELMNAGHYPRNANACVTRGMRCAFYDVCHSGLDPAVRQDLFKRVEDPHPELMETVS